MPPSSVALAKNVAEARAGQEYAGRDLGILGLGLASPPSIELLSNIGLGFLFLLAGYELDPHLLPERPSRLAMAGWTLSAALAIGVVGLLTALHFVYDYVPIGLWP